MDSVPTSTKRGKPRKKTLTRKKRLYVKYYPSPDDPEVFASTYRRPIINKTHILYQDLELIFYCLIGLTYEDIGALYYMTPEAAFYLIRRRKLLWLYRECSKYRNNVRFHNHIRYEGQ
jgi:hypothetical protein